MLLSTRTLIGLWSIEVNAQIDSIKQVFEVSEYVLPKFEVDVVLPSYYTLYVNKPRQQPSLQVTIIARYTYDKPVKGTVKLTARLVPYSSETVCNASRCEWTSGAIELVDGEAHIEIAPKYLSYMASDGAKETVPGNVPAWTRLNTRQIIAIAEVTETVTGVVLSSNNTVTCYSEKYQLDFLDITPDSFKPGLLYPGFLELKQRDGQPPLLSDIRSPDGKFREVTISMLPKWSMLSQCNLQKKIEFNVSLTASGHVTFQTKIDSNCSFNIQASFYDKSTNTTPSTSKLIEPFESKAHLGLQISLKNPDSAVFRAGDDAAFLINSTVDLNTINYVLMGKGEIVLAKTVTNIRTPLYTLIVKLNETLVQKLAPVMRVVVWIVTKNSEVISDSIEVTIEGAIRNNVSVEFDSETVQPGDQVSLEVKAEPGSTAFVLVLDKSVLLLKGGNDITLDMVLGGLSSYDDDIKESPVIWRNPWRSLFFWPIFPSGKDSTEVFKDAKLIYLTDGYVHQKEFVPDPMVS